MMIFPSLDLTDFLRPAYRAWIKIGPGRRSSTSVPSSNFGGSTLRTMRARNGVGRPPRKPT